MNNTDDIINYFNDHPEFFRELEITIPKETYQFLEQIFDIIYKLSEQMQDYANARLNVYNFLKSANI